MARVLVTGMSGAGKSTLLRELARRGRRVLDTDQDGWVLPDARWDEGRLTALLASTPSLVVSGTAENQGDLYPWFDHVVLLDAPLAVLLDRVVRRSDNPYGSLAEDRREIEGYVRDVLPLLRAGATVELDGRRATTELADEVERLMATPGR